MTQNSPPKPAPTPDAEPNKSPAENLLRLLTILQRYAWDFLGILLLALALMTALAVIFPGLSSGVLSWWARLLQVWFGWGFVWPILGLATLGFWLMRYGGQTRPNSSFWGRALLLELGAFATLAFLSAVGGTSLDRAEAGLDGGRIGWGIVVLLRAVLEPLNLGSSFWIALFTALLGLFCIISGLGFMRPLILWSRRFAQTQSGVDHDQVGVDPVVSEMPMGGGESSLVKAENQRKRQPALPAQFRKNFKIQSETSDNSSAPPQRDERLPSLDLLVNEPFSRPDERNINMTAGMIEKTLAEFGIPARVVGFRVGPTVTQFAIEPGYLEKDKSDPEGEQNRQKVRVAQISSLGRDLALALAADRLRIEAPVPGRPYVGIEVPNTRSSVVRLRPILETENFYKNPSQLSIALGRDVSGQPVVADLSRMPHLLIAGTTGSGKSVCIAALTTCLVMNNTPEDLRLVMIDPKMVELVRFNGLPHLYGKVETDLERILAVLRWTVAEMDRRYKVLEASKSRNIDTHNRKVRRKKGEETMPHLVVMIDELADLMMSAPDQTEHNLVRLAQMARAVGIHLVVATQRPSTDVVTGLIKANFPARISFAVASSVDSRVILDTPGAEALLGRGDMLFVPPESSGPVRIQGVMISDPEVERVITFWQKSLAEGADPEKAPWDEMIEQESVLADRDNLVERAIQIVRQTQRASASMLQRRLRIGYPRAARLIDELEDLGVIGEAVSGGREREVLLEREEASEDDIEE